VRPGADAVELAEEAGLAVAAAETLPALKARLMARYVHGAPAEGEGRQAIITPDNFSEVFVSAPRRPPPIESPRRDQP
jgi:hypothetical protein